MLDPSDVTMEVTLWEQRGSWQNPLKKWIIEKSNISCSIRRQIGSFGRETHPWQVTWVGYGKGRLDLQGIF